MSGYVIACYTITVGSIVAYAAWTVSKYRSVTKREHKP